MNVGSADDVLVDICYTPTSGCCHHVRHLLEMNLVVRKANLW